MGFETQDVERKVLAILNTLGDSQEAVGSKRPGITALENFPGRAAPAAGQSLYLPAAEGPGN